MSTSTSSNAPSTRRMAGRLLRWSLVAITFAFIAWALADQWDKVRQAAATMDVHWGAVAMASLVVFATYAALIQSWRLLLAGWGGRLSYPAAVRIWTIANLGRYLPGKVWSIGALGVLATREGVSGIAAAGAAVLGTLLNLGAGFAVTVIVGAEGLDAIAPGFRTLSVVAAAIFVAGVLALPALLPMLLDRFARWRGLPLAEQHLSRREIWLATVINAASWVGYGVAFYLFARGVTPHIAADPALMTSIWAASYLAGYLALFAPGGLGVREFALGALLVTTGIAGQGDAAILAATSRLWLIILEVLPGTIGLWLMPAAQRAALRHTANDGRRQT